MSDLGAPAGISFRDGILCELSSLRRAPPDQFRGRLKFALDLKTPVSDRDVLVVEDIVDTGNSLAFLTEYLQQKSKPPSIKFCCLLDKPSPAAGAGAGGLPPVLLYRIKFVVGMGWITREQYRNLQDILYAERIAFSGQLLSFIIGVKIIPDEHLLICPAESRWLCLMS